MFVVDNGKWKRSERSMHFSAEQATAYIQSELNVLGGKDKQLLEDHLIESLQPDLFFDPVLSREYVKEQMRQQSPLRGEVQEGTVIIRRGQIVSKTEADQLESLRKAYRGEDTLESSLPWIYLQLSKCSAVSSASLCCRRETRWVLHFHLVADSTCRHSMAPRIWMYLFCALCAQAKRM